jgi:hypothetical protein
MWIGFWAAQAAMIPYCLFPLALGLLDKRIRPFLFMTAGLLGALFQTLAWLDLFAPRLIR